MKVKDILKSKGSQVISVTPRHTVLDALKLMAEKNVGGVLVLDNEKLAGIFTERDYARKIVLKQRTSAESRISEVMVENVVTVSPDDDISFCMRLMTDHKFRHLPVVDNGKVAGIVTIGDVVKSVIDEQQNVIDHLEHYIAGQ